jgi:hypothetical protein
MNNKEVRDDPLESSSPEGRVKSEGASRDNESSSEESIEGGEDNIGTCVTDEEEDGADL